MTVLAALYPHVVQGFGLFGVVKETGVDDAGLIEFQERYFGSNPLYRDTTLAFYQALGDRRVGIGAVLNPFALFGLLCDAVTGIRSKTTNDGGGGKGEGVVLGGIIVFDRHGKPVGMYEEETGVHLRVAEIAAALETVRMQCSDT